MGGEISVDSEAGRGARFFFEVTFAAAPPDAADALTAHGPAAVRPLSGKVLLVEDVPVNRVIAEQMLKALGLEVIEAEDGERALAMLAACPVSLVLMDCQMPVMDGFTATQRVREREAAGGGPRTPIIALTANALSGDEERCRAAGMDGYIAKPYTLAQLRAALTPWLGGASVSTVTDELAG